MNRLSTTYVCVIALLALTFSAFFLPPSTLAVLEKADWNALGGLFVLALLAQLAAIDFVAGKQAQSTLAFIPLLAGAIVLPPAATLLTAVPVIAISEIAIRRPILKAVFNVSQITLSVGIGAHVYSWWTAGQPAGHLSYPGVFLLVSLFFAVNIVLSSIAIALFTDAPVFPTFLAVIGPKGSNLLYDILSSPFVIVTVAVYLVYGMGGMFLLILPLLMLRQSYASRQKLEHSNRDLMHALVKAIETRDPYTSGHSKRVEALSRLIAADLGLPGRKIERVRTAALLHDIGKIDTELATVLLKPSALTAEERELIESHAARGANMLRDLGSMDRQIVAAVRHHHERFDGRGYPDGIAGEEIPLAARIIMLSDSVDAMLSDRPYRKALTMARVESELLAHRGTQFDPTLVDVVLQHGTIRKAAQAVAEWQGSLEPESKRTKEAVAPVRALLPAS
jgi:putative nucleotidyltransferase with HDIG domain